MDPTWKEQQERLQKRLAYEERQKQEMSSVGKKGDLEDEEGKCSSVSDDDSDVGPMPDDLDDQPGTSEQAVKKKKRRRVYTTCQAEPNDLLPEELRYVRYSERDVREEIYLAACDLIGIGLSVREALKAVEIVSNRCFGRKFHQSKEAAEIDEDESLEPIDQNTLPNERSVRDMAERIEAQGLAAESQEIITRSKEGEIITHAGHSTTKRHVGKFYVSGIHINKQTALPLPTVPVAREAREEIAQQAALGIEILAAAMDPPISPAEIYKSVDLHLTDSVSHNKFLSEDVPKLFNLDTKPGQIFCSTHTGLGFCANMNTSISLIECKHGIKNILAGFAVDIEYESKKWVLGVSIS